MVSDFRSLRVGNCAVLSLGCSGVCAEIAAGANVATRARAATVQRVQRIENITVRSAFLRNLRERLECNSGMQDARQCRVWRLTARISGDNSYRSADRVSPSAGPGLTSKPLHCGRIVANQ